MENYFIKMHTDPVVVECVTEKVVDFYIAANQKFFDTNAHQIDAFFFGNDLGSQLDLLISPELFDKFILPGLKRIINQAKSYGLKVVMHSCGAIARILPRLIDAGIDAIHPIQARAAGMSAEALAQEYKKDLVFIGGVDTQQMLPDGTPEEVRAEVIRLRHIFGDGFIVSPSHEALLPNVPAQNVIAMSEEACKIL